MTAPNEGKFVLDSARLLAYRDYLRLVELCRVLYHKTGGSRAIMVVTIDEIPKQDDRALSIEEYSMHLYDRFKLSVPGKTEGMIIVMSTNDNKASVRLPNDWPTKIRRQIKQQFARAINDGVSSKNLSEHLVLGIEVIKGLVIQTYQPRTGS